MAHLKKPSGRPIFEKSRNSNFQTRRSGFRGPYPKILIICEGQQEECYFLYWKKQLAPRDINVIPVSTRGGNPIVCVQRAIDERQKIPGWDETLDQCWCCFDSETINERQLFLNAINEAKQKNINLATSVPSFEYWILLHYHEGNSLYQRSRDIDRELRDIIPEYQHGRDISEKLFKRTYIAVQNAAKLRKVNNGRWEQYEYPSTEVDQLINVFLNIIKK